MKTIEIKENRKLIKLDVENLETKSSYIKISEINFKENLLIEISNDNLTNLLDFKSCEDMKVLYLENTFVIGGTYAINNDAGFTIQTTNKSILLSKNFKNMLLEKEEIRKDFKKDIKIGIITPWGVDLVSKKLENWSDVDINGFMSIHYIAVRTSKENYQKAYRFKIVPFDKE